VLAEDDEKDEVEPSVEGVPLIYDDDVLEIEVEV